MNNRKNFLNYLINPILGAFYNNEKNCFLFIDIEQAISQCQS